MSRSPAPSQPVQAQSTVRVAYRRLIWVAPLAAVGALAVNVILYGLGRATGVFSDAVLIPGSQQPLSARTVITNTIAGVLGATIVYALIGFTRNPIPTFRVVAIVVLIGSFTAPFSVPGAGFAYHALLLAMHIVVAGFSVGLLTTLACREEAEPDEGDEAG